MGAAPEMTVWIDLESTGLRLPVVTEDEGPQPDCLLEVAAILTGLDLEPITRYRSLVKPDATAYSRMLNVDFVVDMHTRSGLLDELRTKVDALCEARIVDGQMVDWLRRAGVDKGEAMLAGSGIGHFDFTMAAAYLPKLVDHLHYRQLDISSLRAAFRLAGGPDLSAPNSSKTHRAMDDVECHLEEARAYFRAIRSASPEAAAA